YDACQADRFPSPVCDPVYGKGESGGCGCAGLSVSFLTEATLITKKAAADKSADVRDTNCRTTNIGQRFRQIADENGLVTLFTGFQTGVHKSWPARAFNTQN